MGVVVFADRIILSAQDPISPEQLGQVAALCAGPIPAELLDLWGACFGGELDYDLPVRFGDHLAQFGMKELFYTGSPHYRDLLGWIEHEQELAAEAAGARHLEPVRYLPFGGFEYLDRSYLDVGAGPHRGSVLAYMQKLPPAWRLRLYQNSVARVAPSPTAFFHQLVLEDDPWALSTDYPSGHDTAEVLNDLASKGAVAGRAADKLRQHQRSLICDRRRALAAGTLAADVHLRRLASDHSVAKDDVSVVEHLLGAGWDVAEPYRGGGTALDHALRRGALDVTWRLLRADAPVDNVLVNGAANVTLELAEVLVDRGAVVDVDAVCRAAAERPEVGARLAGVLLDRDPGARESLRSGLLQAARRAVRLATDKRAGRLYSETSVADYLAQAVGLKSLADGL